MPHIGIVVKAAEGTGDRMIGVSEPVVCLSGRVYVWGLDRGW